MGHRNPKEYLKTYRDGGLAGLPESFDPTPAPVEGPVFTGRIMMIDDVRGFGLIRHEQEGRRQKVFFHVSDVEGKPALRATATFELKPDDRDGRIIARNVRIDQDSAPSTEAPKAQARTKMRLIAAAVRGRVISFDPIKAFGFICTEADCGYQRVFFHAKAITRDSLGHRHDGVAVGTAVTFDIAEFEVGETGGMKKTAQNVQPVHRTEVDVSTHREFSRVTFWDGKHGFLERSCGNAACNIAFFLKDITTMGAEEIKVGEFVQHGVMPRGRIGSQVRASSIVLFELGFQPPPVYPAGSAEEYFASLEAQPEPDPQPEPEQVYSPQEKKLSLRELIRRRKIAA